jgi:hypothetical protein
MIGHYYRVTPERLDELKEDPCRVPDVIYSPDTEEQSHLDIDKSWHAIHFLLTGSVWEGDLPWRNVVLGGTILGEDLGCGPARYLTPEEVREVSAALEQVPPQELVARYDAERLTEANVYPQIWQEGEVARTYLQDYYQQLYTFFCIAARQGEAVLTYLN